MKTLIFGAGNLLLSDEGFGVHAIRHLEENYAFPEEVELYDGGTLGIMVTHKFEEAERIYILDVIEGNGAPGELRRYEKDDIMLGSIPVKLSPHQIGIQETLLMSEIRGFCPEKVTLLGVLPSSLDASDQLSPVVRPRLEDIAAIIIDELAAEGTNVLKKAA
ncbi:MAG TPA: HyaD/HybD family hydrogenase maturation endopeptidase [Geobacteraceae bacterium]|nr:HyaD/HybD family hydrogenase maturation endopeptidase [Geobacteraceae bacterium]